MKFTINIARSASGQGTVVNVTATSNGITGRFGLKSSASSIGKDVTYCKAQAVDMVKQAQAAIDEEAAAWRPI